jgi:hypothetical protein
VTVGLSLLNMFQPAGGFVLNIMSGSVVLGVLYLEEIGGVRHSDTVLVNVRRLPAEDALVQFQG